ncbi:hypothetical protein [Nocardia sp. NPDC057353]|uniref:hypothetical protein n=1 Tax=Nocardia sp. NPDC057353 TaxID=3346104 RepID=UPI003645A556
MAEQRAVTIASTSRAADLGYLALRDLAAAAAPPEPAIADYRVIGGHMVQLLAHAYPGPEVRPRATADADAGIARPIAAGRELHHRLLALGYEAVRGNSYRRDAPGGVRAIDLLVPFGTGGTEEIAGRAFDAAPGLGLALATPPIVITAAVLLHASGEQLAFTAALPGVEAAVVLKALIWRKRFADRDLVDLHTLFEIVQQHRAALPDWRLDRAPLRASRADAAAALRLAAEHPRLAGRAGPVPSARLAALIRRHVRLGG